MKTVIVLAVLIFSSFAFADHITLYPEENRIMDGDIRLYRKALKQQFVNQELDSCNIGKNQVKLKMLLLDFAMGKDERWYLTRSEQPLIVIQLNTEDIKDYFNLRGADRMEARIHTNEEYTEVEYVELLLYSVVHENTNMGTLADPIFKDITTVSTILHSACYSQIEGDERW